MVETTEQLAPALERALFGARPDLLELRLAADAITPSTTLSAVRDEALKRRRGTD